MNTRNRPLPAARPGRRQRWRGVSAFTLVELIAVLAVLGILAAILVPVVGRAQESARRARVKTQFAQWAVAIDGFRAEYGYLPNFAATTTAPLPSASRVNEVPGLFHQTLVGRREDGAVPDLVRAQAANPRRVAFLNFGVDELGDGVNPPIRDAFGNTDIVILVDRDGDGLIPAPSPIPAVVSVETGRTLTPDAGAFPDGGVRAAVLFYSAGAGRNAEDIIYSWR
jgi:prepilin-type N-terminal cleavage/methylation domain-containing protein